MGPPAVASREAFGAGLRWRPAQPGATAEAGGGSVFLAVLRETASGERRVSLVPDQVGPLGAAGLDVLVEPGAGALAWHADEAYAAAGAAVVPHDELCARAGLVVCVNRPADAVLNRLRPGTALVGLLGAVHDAAYARRLAAHGLTAIDLVGLPRTLSRAQAMDALTSQANVAGYKAALVAAGAFGGYFPMLVTAAGTARPARVLVLGAGVAGLQAIGTARRLGAVVSAYDIRPEGRSDAASVGATVLRLPADTDETAEAGQQDGGGYARELSAEDQRGQRDALASHIARHDVVITAAQVPGRRPPTLVDDEAVKGMAPGSVVVDLAAGPDGGNVDGSVPDQTVLTDNGVRIIGAGDLAATVPSAASAAYSRNLEALLRHLVREGDLALDLTDEIQAGVVATHGGRVVHPNLVQGDAR
jgi:NAD(P) transhydrogenase subunit alpha